MNAVLFDKMLKAMTGDEPPLKRNRYFRRPIHDRFAGIHGYDADSWFDRETGTMVWMEVDWNPNTEEFVRGSGA